jgi:hypothetical protein
MDYSGKIESDLSDEIQNRGGIEKLISELKIKKQFPDEIKRINKEIRDLYKTQKDIGILKTSIHSDILPKETADEIIEKQVIKIVNEIKDQSITSRTIIGSVLGVIIASLVSGTIWGLSIIYSGRMIFILLPGLVIISYLIIWLCTKQSRKNTMVFISTFLATFLAVIIGILLYKFIGYHPL